MARAARRRPAVSLKGTGDGNADCDVLVVGAGINGAGIARDAAGRGLRTVLCEQHDVASHTSSASTKLIHGGLRYLEYYDFGLVRKSLHEREVVLANAPHLAKPLRFVLPHDRHLRPAWMLRAGLLLYDHLAVRRRLPGSETVDLRRHPAGAPLAQQFRTGFLFSDGWVDDARLVIANAIDVRERGGRVLTRTKCVGLKAAGQRWVAKLQGGEDGSAGGSAGNPSGRNQSARDQAGNTSARNQSSSPSARNESVVQTLTARLVVNATGPWVAEFLDEHTPRPARHHPRMIQGSHIVVRRLFEHDYAYLFQAKDGRVVFAIPFERELTLVGTTEREYEGDLARPAIDEAEMRYLLDMVNGHFGRRLTRRDVVWTFAGLRPLLAASTQDPKSITRDYVLDFDRSGPPLLSVYGGKLTTYRRLAQDVVDMVCDALGSTARPWTERAPLPGGDIPGGDFDLFRKRMSRRHAWLDRELLHRYARAYGTRLEHLLQGCSSMSDLGEMVLPGLTAREIDYLRREEFAVTAEDILYRRSKLGVRLPSGSAARLDRWLAAHA